MTCGSLVPRQGTELAAPCERVEVQRLKGWATGKSSPILSSLRYWRWRRLCKGLRLTAQKLSRTEAWIWPLELADLAFIPSFCSLGRLVAQAGVKAGLAVGVELRLDTVSGSLGLPL